MSLINKALQQEQQRRHINYDAAPPMVTRALKRQGERGAGIVVAFALLGLVLSGGTAAFFYFGSSYLGSATLTVASPSETPNSSAALANSSTQPAPEQATPSENTHVPIATIKKMLDEKTEALERIALEQPLPAVTSEPAAPVKPAYGDEQIRRQGVVDNFTVQGIRKSATDTRVFLNGKIQKLGDTVDLANGLALVALNDNQLVFQDLAGFTYTKNF